MPKKIYSRGYLRIAHQQVLRANKALMADNRTGEYGLMIRVRPMDPFFLAGAHAERPLRNTHHDRKARVRDVTVQTLEKIRRLNERRKLRKEEMVAQDRYLRSSNPTYIFDFDQDDE